MTLDLLLGLFIGSIATGFVTSWLESRQHKLHVARILHSLELHTALVSANGGKPLPVATEERSFMKKFQPQPRYLNKPTGVHRWVAYGIVALVLVLLLLWASKQ